MKKILTMLVAVCAMTFAITSCQNKDKGELSIAGTEWTSTEMGGISLAFDQTTFTAFSAGKEKSKGTYTYVHPTVTMTGKNVVTTTGTISGNQMSVTTDGKTVVLTKK